MSGDDSQQPRVRDHSLQDFSRIIGRRFTDGREPAGQHFVSPAQQRLITLQRQAEIEKKLKQRQENLNKLAELARKQKLEEQKKTKQTKSKLGGSVELIFPVSGE